jgi:hypothetical protein
MHCGVEVTEFSTNKQHHRRKNPAVFTPYFGVNTGTFGVNTGQVSIQIFVHTKNIVFTPK